MPSAIKTFILSWFFYMSFLFLMTVDWEIEVIESRETACNLAVIMPYDAGK